MIRFGSVCSGIEAASVAWEPLGWRPSFFSEIDKFPRAVLTHHYPQVPLHGDFTTIQERQYEPIDLLVGGTPCQSFSVAGRRLGLDDPRGNLAIEYCRLARRLRPRWIVWENVPGVLSSNGGRDFGAFLGLLVECGYGFAYRVLDAQYVRVDGYARAVPQRRPRVFVVGHFGDWRRAASILFEPESLRGHTPPSRQTSAGDGGVFPCLTRRGPGSLREEEGYVIEGNGGIRHLTPRECERLQGFPEGYTDITWRGKETAPDGPRYRALGNSMAVNVMRWIGMRIAAAELSASSK